MTHAGHAALLTQCPHCETVFRLNASLLAVARGFVECGECAKVFYSLERLADEPPPASPKPLLAPAPELPRVLMHPVPETEVLESVQATIDPQLVRDIEELPANEIPLALRDDVARRQQRAGARRKQRWDRRWARFATVLLVVFGLQIGWASRGLLLARFPVATPWLEQACAFAGCRAHPAAPPPTIELQARDVREHPQYQNALLVNASLINREPAPAPFPVLQLGIFDHNGTLIGVRRFKPAEYLDSSVDIASGMPPARTLHVVLEIAGVSERAEGFEFTFL
jgi:predicted Zn finger-like uncharacterized protein